jgi:hypothetical protein
MPPLLDGRANACFGVRAFDALEEGSRSSRRSRPGWCSGGSGSSGAGSLSGARSTDEGKKLTALDGLRVIATLLRCRFTTPARATFTASARATFTASARAT